MKIFCALFVCFFVYVCTAQDKPGTPFSGSLNENSGACPKSMSALRDEDVDGMITEMLQRYGLKNRFVIISCPQIDNCQATLFNGKPVILYNAEFLNEVKRLNFSEKIINTSEKNWKALTILAHEVGHHLNNHLSNPLPSATQIDMELEADKIAGFIIYQIGGTLMQAQLAFNDIPENEGYTHPGRQKRLDAVEKGWNDALTKYPPSGSINDVSSVTDIDGNYYKAIRIGGQVWMQSNLEATHYQNGDLIPQVQDPIQWKNLTTGAWCWYENDEANGKKFGKLYNWYAVNDSRGLAPKGWHVPTAGEFTQLENYLGVAVAGGKMKAIELWGQPNVGATNISGFTGLPAGIRTDYGHFVMKGDHSFIWTSSEISYSDAWYRVLNQKYKDLPKVARKKTGGYSVRCVKD